MIKILKLLSKKRIKNNILMIIKSWNMHYNFNIRTIHIRTFFFVIMINLLLNQLKIKILIYLNKILLKNNHHLYFLKIKFPPNYNYLGHYHNPQKFLLIYILQYIILNQKLFQNHKFNI